MGEMNNKIVFGLLWFSFIGYTFFLAPPDQSTNLDLIINLSTGKWTGINPLVIALFNLMGILPMIYVALMLIDGRTQKLSAGLFSAASFAVGAFAILPYLALRESNSKPIGERSGMIKLVDSRWVGLFLSIGTLVLLAYGLTQGDWTDFVQQ